MPMYCRCVGNFAERRHALLRHNADVPAARQNFTNSKKWQYKANLIISIRWACNNKKQFCAVFLHTVQYFCYKTPNKIQWFENKKTSEDTDVSIKLICFYVSGRGWKIIHNNCTIVLPEVFPTAPLRCPTAFCILSSVARLPELYGNRQ